MTACRWDSEAKDYFRDGQPCRHDDYGDPTRHCTARRTCSQHVGWGELTCARCISQTRKDLKVIRNYSALLPVVAASEGATSEPADLAGPGADYQVFSARRALDRRWLYGHIPDHNLARAIKALLEDDDEWHPYSVLTRWHMMLAEDYHHDLPAKMTVEGSGAYLDRNLNLMAQDERQDFPLFRSEIRRCRTHLMSSGLHLSTYHQKGAPCPECVAQGGVNPEDVRLVRTFGHWCTDDDCEQIHYLDESGDVWVCPNDDDHWWTAAGYAEMREKRTA